MYKIKSISEYFFSLLYLYSNKIKIIYYKTNFYNKKISKNIPSKYTFKPSPHIINCLVSFNKKKIKIEDLSLNSIWKINSNNKNEFEILHSFLWLNTLDIKTSKTSAQNIIENWIENNNKFDVKTWKIDILSKRLISWLSNTNLTLNNANENFKKKFTLSIIRQINHLYRSINNEKNYEHKIIGCASIILIGLIFNEYKKFFNLGLELIKKIIKTNFDDEGFPFSRNIQELGECLKYFILIREWIKESQTQIPEFLDNIIYNSGISFNFINEQLDNFPLFNGSSEIENKDFKTYLNLSGYSFKTKNNLHMRGGYTILKNKKILLIMDVGDSVEEKYSKKYQYGCLSFELFSNKNKLITNSGFYLNRKNKLNEISKSTAAHSTLYLNNHSSCIINRSNIKQGLRISNKKFTTSKNIDKINASHNGYQKRFGYIHEREIQFLKNEKKFLGKDNLIRNGKSKNLDFIIRFHIYPGVKIAKTQKSNTILLSVKNGDGWKFTCMEAEISIEKGIFLGNKNKIIKNENIYISGITQGKDLFINWTFEKIS